MSRSPNLGSQRRGYLKQSVALIALTAGLDTFGAGVVSAQQSATSDALQGEEEGRLEIEEISVTGTRIKRDAFTSTSPVQVLDAEQSVRIGVTSISEMLQRSTVTVGQQIDSSFVPGSGSGAQTFPGSGLGSSNINLRGLGPERVLVMVNDKRLGLAGVRGAPVQPDLSLIPLGMVQTIDVLTGGQSTIYGADAVAGVVNVKLRDDFSGIEVFGSSNLPEAGGGEQFRSSFVTGHNWESGNFIIGFEYFKRERLRAEQRDFSDCIKRIEVAEDGERFSTCRATPDNIVTLRGGIIPQLPPGAPLEASPTGTISPADATRPRFIPGLSAADSDIGIENFGSAFNLPQTGEGLLPIPGPGAPFAVFRGFFADFWNTQDEARAADMVFNEERFSVVSSGGVELPTDGRHRLYYEAYYFNRQNNIRDTNEQLVFEIPSGIRQEDENGNIITDDNNNPILVDNPLNPFPFAPELGAATSAEFIVTLDDLPREFDVEVEQFRGVIGFEGDLPNTWLEDRNWTYNGFFSYDRGIGFQAEPFLFEPNLILATQTVRVDSEGNLKCGNELPANSGGNLTPNECVPLRAAAESIFTGGTEGRFSSQAERDFLLGDRLNRTVVEQFNSNLVLTGDVVDIPWGGTVGMAFGGEWRLDRINSTNDFVGVRGLLASSNPTQEGNTIGSRYIYDIFGEVSVPILVNQPFADLLQFDGAVRFTEEENFGSEVIWRAGGVYRPVSYLTFTASRNTSFRAPNLREQFLANQGGTISQGQDPCVESNFAAFPPGPAKDILAQNCALDGADVTQVGIRGLSSIEVNIGGAGDRLNAETSDSTTLSVQFSQPWFDNFDLDLAVTYWNIDITNTVRELDPSTIINRCFFDSVGLNSPFCELVERADSPDPANDLITFVDASFVNIGQESANGVDFNARSAFRAGSAYGEPIDVVFSASATHLVEQTRKIFPDSPEIDNAGRIGNPEWTFTTATVLDWGRFSLQWETRFIGQTAFDDDVVDPAAQNAFQPSTIFATNKLVRLDPVADRRLYNDLSFSGAFSTLRVTVGVQNLTDQDPPLIDASAGPNRNNAVTSSGFDLFGRTFFANATVSF